MTADERQHVRVKRDEHVRATVQLPPDPRWRHRHYAEDRANTTSRRRWRWANDPDYRRKRLEVQYRRRARPRAAGVPEWWRR